MLNCCTEPEMVNVILTSFARTLYIRTQKPRAKHRLTDKGTGLNWHRYGGEQAKHRCGTGSSRSWGFSPVDGVRRQAGTGKRRQGERAGGYEQDRNTRGSGTRKTMNAHGASKKTI